MDKEQIKNEILIRLEIEREVRRQLDQSRDLNAGPKKSAWVWLESKLALLIIGAVLSGVLVPTFQFTQEKIKWHKQNRYDSLERQLGSIRESLKQFIAVQALSAELYDLGLRIIDTRTVGGRKTLLDEWRKEFHAIQARRVQQSSAFFATVFYFPIGSQESIRKAWNKLMLPSVQLQTIVGGLLGEGPRQAHRSSLKRPSTNDIAVELDAKLVEVNQAYEDVLSVLKQQLMEVENESAKFR
jgi:hypothetical protein